jgi:hypothetical protein
MDKNQVMYWYFSNGDVFITNPRLSPWVILSQDGVVVDSSGNPDRPANGPWFDLHTKDELIDAYHGCQPMSRYIPAKIRSAIWGSFPDGVFKA